MYYLQTRYYDPAICRFISPDELGYLGANGDLTGYNLYAYCSNNPVMCCDPSGHIAISTLIALITVGIATLVTAATATYGMVEEETIVLDLSYVVPVKKNKVGGSLLIDFSGGNIEFYPHAGKLKGIGSGFSYSVGKVRNYNNPGDYAGPFIFCGGGYIVGIDACADPRDSKGTSATSITFSFGGSLYAGGDKYLAPISYNYKRREFNKFYGG